MFVSFAGVMPRSCSSWAGGSEVRRRTSEEMFKIQVKFAQGTEVTYTKAILTQTNKPDRPGQPCTWQTGQCLVLMCVLVHVPGWDCGRRAAGSSPDGIKGGKVKQVSQARRVYPLEKTCK